MGDIFQEVVCAPVPNDLINDNYLIKPVYYSISSIDTSKIKTTPGKDFTKKQLNVICNVPEVISSAVEHWLRLAAGRPTIAFTAGVEHARSLAEAFQSTGITAIAIDGSMSREQRKVYYDRLARGELLVLCSCEALSEGFNVPCISCILLCRPTKSRAKFLQQIGRGLRLSEGKSDCLILDQANLVLQFGYIEDLNAGDFSLAASEEKTRKHTPPLKVCPNCQKLLYSFQRSCPCSYQFPVGQIKKMASGELTRNLHPQDLEAFTFIREELVKVYALGLHPDTAVHSYRERYGSRQLPQDWLRGAIFGEEPSPEQRSALREYLSRVAQARRIPKYWIDEQMKRLL
jgi:superfamily II DNA or RNA helicase